MEYIKDGSVLPIPFNIIPTPTLIIESCYLLFRCKLEKSNTESRSYRIDDHSQFSKANGHVSSRRKQEEELTFKVKLKIY